MKRVFALVSLIGALTASADSYLYWMVDTTKIDSQYKYDTVMVAAKSGSDVSYLNLYYGDSTSGGGNEGKSISSTAAGDYASAGLGFYAALLTNPESYSYAIELFNGTTYVAQSEAGWVNYAYLAEYVVNSPMQKPVQAWMPAGSGYAVPEPSSALLTLIGCALLGLRRKKPQA